MAEVSMVVPQPLPLPPPLPLPLPLRQLVKVAVV